MRTRRDDSGSTHVLEAIIVATIMVSVVTFVVTFDTPPAASAPTRNLLQQQADDALNILYDTGVVDTGFGDNALSVYLANCLVEDDCHELRARLSRLLPAGASYAVYISNGDQLYPVYEPRQPSGEAVSASRLFEPKWSYSFVANVTNATDGQVPLTLYSLPIYNSNPITQGGSPLQVKAYGTRVNDGSDYILTSFQSTQAFAAPHDTSQSALSLYFVDELGEPVAIADVRSESLSGGNPTNDNITFRLRLEESAGVSVRAGLNLSIQMPRGWTASIDPATVAGVWEVTEMAHDRNGSWSGSDLRMRLIDPFESDHRDIEFQAVYHGDSPAYYPFRASLSRGALAVAEMLVRAGNATSGGPADVPHLVLSVPRPMGGAGTETTWTLSALIAQNETLTSYLSGAVVIDRIEIVEQEGKAIFGGLTPIDEAGGSWSNEGDRLVWQGSQYMDMDSPLGLTFRVEASGVASSPGSREPFVAPVTFDGWTGRLIHQHGPGFHRDVIHPAATNAFSSAPSYAGYQSTFDVFNPSDMLYDVISNAAYRTTAMPGTTHYMLRPSTGIEDAIYGSYLNVEKRNVPLGGSVAMTSNVQSVLYRLAQLDIEAGVSLTFYPPWSKDTRASIPHPADLNQAFLGGEPSAMLVVDLNGDGVPDPVIGTTNGRLFALHGQHGGRLPALQYNLPLRDGNAQTTATVTSLELLHLPSGPYIVIGTGAESTGVIVLDLDFNPVWRFDTLQAAVVSMDTSHDFTGDGRRDIVVGLDNSAVYVLEALDGNTLLQPVPGQQPDKILPNAFHETLGQPLALRVVESAGPYGDGPGLVVTVQTTVDPGVRLYFDDPLFGDEGIQEPTVSRGAISTPRAGLRGVDSDGRLTSMAFGSPVSVARTYDYDGDGITDIVGGGNAGYVFMYNGSVLTQPLYSYIWPSLTRLIDAQSLSSAESYLLTSSGEIYFTDDDWQTMYCAACDVSSLAGAKAIGVERTSEVWAVGTLGQVWRSQPSLSVTEGEDGYLDSIQMVPHVMAVTDEGGAPFLTLATHTLNDIHWEPGTGHGWIVGDPCPISCTTPLLLHTADGGDTWQKIAISTPGALKRLHVDHDGVKWAVGTKGLLLRSFDGATWTDHSVDSSHDLTDISCSPETVDMCWATAKGGWAFRILKAHDTVIGTAPAVQIGEASGKDLLSVGMRSDAEVYIGSVNRVLKTWSAGLSWSTLPMNYLEADATRIAMNADGTGYIVGGGATSRLWFLHDYMYADVAVTNVLGDLPSGAKVTRVELAHSNVTGGLNKIFLDVATTGDEWIEMGEFTPPPFLDGVLEDGRDWRLTPLDIPAEESGNELRFRFRLTTAGDSTLMTPHVRGADFVVHYELDGTVHEQEVSLDFRDDGQVDPALTTAAWDIGIGSLRHSFVQEHWVRNVSGGVRDIQTGYDVWGDTRDEVWVATGGILALNSPDHIIYAGTDESKLISPDNRVYLLDGATGHIINKTASFGGPVTALRLADTSGDGAPDVLFATVQSEPHGRVVALHPESLELIWQQEMSHETPVAIEIGAWVGGEPSLAMASRASVDGSNPMSQLSGHIWHISSDGNPTYWKVLPDERGRYTITVPIPGNWLYGPYVAEIRVEWEDQITKDGMVTEIVRAARFYDYFVVTPPDSLSPPTPIYGVHLVTWFDDWS